MYAMVEASSVDLRDIHVTIITLSHSCFQGIVIRDIRRKAHLCGPVVRVPGYRSKDPGSIPGTTRFSEK
jgi:hypothetical protein